mmetsp:Transcript_32523/g.103587  ORF Transcript_32523/g.103587 Transcript_32523/m.103587 type:complete len:494 (-) Transcript_32523:58-1539(-)
MRCSSPLSILQPRSVWYNETGHECLCKDDACFDECAKHLWCPLLLPSIAQVENCRATSIEVVAATIENRPHPMVSGRNYIKFDDVCLQNATACPNCAVLASRLPLAAELVSGAPVRETRYLQAAELYILQKRVIEQQVPEVAWDWKGSIFFATTVLSTIGYGTSAPQTDASKAILACFALPAIAAFGLALGEMSSLALLGINNAFNLARKKMKFKSRYTYERAIERIRSSKRLDGMPDTLTITEFLDAFKEEDPKIREEMATYFEDMDEDEDGGLDSEELLHFVMKMQKLDEAERTKKSASTELHIVMMLFCSFLLFGTGVFYAVEDDWSFLDSFYFCVITITTVGLGDFAPALSNSKSMGFWYVFVLFGTGLAATAIAAVGSMLAARNVVESLSDSIEMVGLAAGLPQTWLVRRLPAPLLYLRSKVGCYGAPTPGDLERFGGEKSLQVSAGSGNGSISGRGGKSIDREEGLAASPSPEVATSGASPRSHDII